jgi:hypothetical protein
VSCRVDVIDEVGMIQSFRKTASENRVRYLPLAAELGHKSEHESEKATVDCYSDSTDKLTPINGFNVEQAISQVCDEVLKSDWIQSAGRNC